MKKSIYLLIALMATVVTGCMEDEGPDVPSGNGGAVVINEAHSRGKDSQYPLDWVELYNKSDEAVDISGYVLSDKADMSEKITIPAGTTLGAREFFKVEVDTDDGFGLSSDGDVVYLYNDQGQNIDNIEFGPMDTDESWSANPDGSDTFEMMTPTPGASNTDGSGGGDPDYSKLFINEVKVSDFGADEQDWIEFYNAGDVAIDMAGLKILDSGDEAFTIPAGNTIAAGGFIIFAEDAEGSFDFGLGKSGETVELRDAQDNRIDFVDLTPAGELGDNAFPAYARTTDGGPNWARTETPTKNASNASAPATSDFAGKIVINEVYTFSDQATVDDLDWIELYNTTGEAIDIGGLKLWEGGGSEEAWTIPAGKTIPANGRIVFESDKEGLHNDPTNYPAWGLSKNGDMVVLADAELTVIDRVDVPLLDANQSYGRSSDGDGEWRKFAQHTKNAENEGPEPGVVNTTGVYVNEVYHDNTDAEAYRGIDPPRFDITIDFIELYNSNNEAVDVSGWEIYDDKMEDCYVIPASTTIPAKGFLTYDVYKDNASGPTLGLGVGGDAIFLCTPGTGDIASRATDRLEVVGFPKDEDAVGGIGQRDFGYTVGRLTDGGNDVVIFVEGSKNASNNGKQVLQ